jgi:competence protein ComEC
VLARALPVVLAAAAAGAIVAGVRVAPLLPAEVLAVAERDGVAAVEAVVVADPVPLGESVRGVRRTGPASRVRLVVTRVRAAGLDTEAAMPASLVCGGLDGLLPGTRVAGRATVHPGDLLRGTSLRLGCRAPFTVVQGAPAVQVAAGRWRQGLVEAATSWPGQGAQLLPGLVLGDTRAVPEDLAAVMRRVGLSHLVAVSGANVAVVVGAVLAVAAALGVPRRWRAPLVGLALLGFVVLVRAEPSVVRAATMAAVLVVAMTAGGRRRGPPALAMAVLVLVLADPWLSVSLGFALSVAATAGLLLWARPWADRVRRRWPRLPAWLVDALAVTAAAQVATAPLVVGLGSGLGLVALPANLLAVPAVAPATVLGVAATVLSTVSAPAAHLVAGPAVLAATWVVVVARAAAAVPGGVIPWPAGAAGAAALVVAAGAAVLAVRVPRATTLVAAVTAVVVVLVALPRPGSARWPPPGWLAVACDVGQGDALVLADGEGAGVVVDAGPDPDAVDRCLRDLGVSRVPAVVLTHFHADHVEGLTGVLAGRSVGEVVVSPLREPADEAERVSTWADAAGVPVRTAAVGETVDAGTVRWRVLWPARLLRSDGSPPNNASVVLLVEAAGRRLLLGGDLEPAAQSALERLEPPLAADLIKVPHHGSRRQEPGFAAWSGARLALVSVGRDNDYGHPAPATLAAYAEAGIAVARTDTGGDLAVVDVAGALTVVARGPPG